MTTDRSRMLPENRSMAARSGCSSSTISTKSPPIGAGPTTRMRSFSRHSRVLNASTMAGKAAMARMSKSWSTGGSLSEPASSRRVWPVFLAADAVEELLGEAGGHHAAGGGLQHQGGGVGGRQAVLEPAQAEIGDRRH